MIINLLTFIYVFKFCLSFENVPTVSGLYTEGFDTVQDKVEIIYPEKVSKDGTFVSHYLPQYYNMESTERQRRTPGFRTASSKDAVHFFIPIEGEKYHLELWPNVDFISPGLVVERRDARDIENVNKAKISHVSQRQCHYSGQIVGKENSVAALSTCYGLAGYIRVPSGNEYFIEPVKDTKPTDNKEHPHIIYKRSGMKDRNGGSNCLTKGSAKGALEERIQWEALFGDGIKKIMSGFNVSEIIQENIGGISSQRHFENIMPQNSVEKENSQTVANFNKVNTNNLERTDINTVNKRLPGNSVQEERTLHENNEAFSKSIKPVIRNLQLENEMKQNQIKSKRNIGKASLSELNSHPLEPDETNMDDPREKESIVLDHKETDDNDFKHDRRKRDVNYDQNELNVEQNYESVDIDDDNGILKNQKVKQNIDKNKVKCVKELKQRSIASDSRKHGHSSSNNDEETHPENSLRETKEESAKNKLKTDKNIPVNNQEGTEPDAKELVVDSDLNDQQNEKNLKLNNTDFNKNILETLDLSSGDKNNDKEDMVQSHNKEHDGSVKREVHLDTSDKSWQLGNKYEKINTISNMKNKEILQRGGSDQSPQKGLDSESQNQSANELVGDKTKELDSSKSSKVDEDSLNKDKNKENRSEAKPIIDDSNKVKVKKDIGLNEVLSNVRTENKIRTEQDPKFLNQQENADDNVQKSNKQTTSSNLKSVQDKDKIVVTNQKVSSKNKELTDNTDKLAASNNIEEFINKNNGNIEQIIIKFRDPDNNIHDIKKTTKTDFHGSKKGNNFNTDSADDNKQKIISSPINDELNQNSMNSVTIKESIRGVSDKGTIKEQVDKFYSQNIKTDEGTTLKIKEEDSVKSKNNTKREDNIHLVTGIETEPETKQALTGKENAPRPNLFCQGKNCLEIKPVLLNELNITANAPAKNSHTSFNNTDTDIAKTKTVGKREIVENNLPFEECSTTTTFKPLLCFDFRSKDFYLELMITVDYKVVEMHGDDDIENFILTIVNMVSNNFHDKSIGINLSVMLIRLILLTTCIKELDSERFNPEELLENFCTWQTLINPGKDDHPHHHDLAIFVTRMDKCEGQVTGVAYMTSVCRPDKACIVCVDEGLLLANTITHQIGHTFGAEHDDGQSSGCSSTAPDGTSYHMASTIRETSHSWSICSQDVIIQSLRTLGYLCLTDRPAERDSYDYPLMLPGQIYSAAQQCRLNYHMAAVPCAIGAFCEKLYCQVTEKLCATKGDPPADGTFCASDMWCFHKECVHIGRRPGAVNGEWGPWSEWATCTRSCGGGVSSSYRICDNPKPSNGGRYCIGERLRHRMCATQSCQGFTESFRDLQCKKTEERPFHGVIHNWSQYNSFFINIECALVCQNRKGNIVMRSPIVADGTPCKAGTRNVCIQGVCKNVGCDWVIDSFAKEDACGVCHGNSTECKIIQGVFDETANQRGMVEFLRVPKNSGMVFIREIAPSTNVLAASGAVNKVFYLNGKGTDDSMPGDVAFGVTHGIYDVSSGMERIFIRGPTNEDLIFYVTFREPNRGIHFQYAVPEYDPTYVPRYLWQYLDWDPCSDPCSGGTQRAQAKCVEDKGGVVDDSYCPMSSKPADVIRPCNDFPCQAKWWVSVWSDCICTGSSSFMFRSVLCMQATDESGTRSEIVKESECADHKKPPTQKLCNDTEEEPQNCFSKRSAQSGEMFRTVEDRRRAIHPSTAYLAWTQALMENSDINESEQLKPPSVKTDNVKDHSNKNKKQKKYIKAEDNFKEIEKVVMSPQQNKKELLVKDSKQETNLNVVNTNDMKTTDDPKKINNPGSRGALDINKQADKLAYHNNSFSESHKNKDPEQLSLNMEIINDVQNKSSATESASLCDQSNETTASTCQIITNIEPHNITTCCKTDFEIILKTKPAEPTTKRPVFVQVDEMANFGITVSPVELDKKKSPLTDPDFLHFGNIGQYGVVNENNGTILAGQTAIDFLEFSRSRNDSDMINMNQKKSNG